MTRSEYPDRKSPISYNLKRCHLSSISEQTAVLYLDQVLKITHDPKGSSYDVGIFAMVTPLPVRHGKKEAALEILERGAEAEVVPYDFLMLNPDLRSLQSDSRFQKIAAKARKQFDEMLAILQEARSRGEFPKYLEKPLADLLKQLGI